jgi:hypothetical protein
MTIRSRPASAAIDRMVGWISAWSALERSICALRPCRAGCAANVAAEASAGASASLMLMMVMACARARYGAASRRARAARGASSPCDPDAFRFNRAFMRMGDEENRTTGLKKGLPVAWCCRKCRDRTWAAARLSNRTAVPRRGPWRRLRPGVRERPEAIVYARVARFGFKDRKGRVGDHGFKLATVGSAQLDIRSLVHTPDSHTRGLQGILKRIEVSDLKH